MRRPIDKPSYLAGALSGFLLACLVGVFCWLRASPRIEGESSLQQTTIAIHYLDDVGTTGPNRQGMLDTIANTYAHCRMGILSSRDLIRSIEDAAKRHPDLANEIQKRKHLWESNQQPPA